MEVGLGAGRILLLMAGLVWIFRVAVGKRPTAGNADGMHASSIKRATESPSNLHLDRGGRNNSLRVNDSRSATISRGSAALPCWVTAPHASPAPAGIVVDAVVVKSCPSKKSKLRPAAALPSLDAGKQQASCNASAPAPPPPLPIAPYARIVVSRARPG